MLSPPYNLLLVPRYEALPRNAVRQALPDTYKIRGRASLHTLRGRAS